MAEQQILGYDYTMPYADGTDNVTTALRELLNSYPELPTGDEITFSVLNADSGKAMFPTSSVAILSEKEDITGHVEQLCVYSFMVIYRVGGLTENRKANVKEWLDNLGRWLNGQKVKGNTLSSYPVLTGNKAFKKISPTSQCYLYSTSESKIEDWAITIQAQYRNEFDRINL